MAGVVHFARFFVFMEAAEHEFLRSLSPGLPLELEGRSVLWPRVTAACNYRKPALFRDLLEFHLTVARRGKTSLDYRFSIRRDGEEIAVGHLVTVYCSRDPGGQLRPLPIPRAVAASLGQAVVS